MVKIKSWNKVRDTQGHILYVQDKVPSGFNQTLVIRNFPPIWEVSIGYERSDNHHSSRKFKTKEEAVKFAMIYMKAHQLVTK